MHITTSKRILIALFLTLVVATPSSYVYAAKNTGSNDGLDDFTRWLRGQSSHFKKNIKKLDKKTVEEFSIPILFGVNLAHITPNFGAPRDGGARTHEGLDIMGLEGTPVVTPTEAVVIKKGTAKTPGNYVYTQNPGGEIFAYMHLASIANIKPGQLLAVGDPIGTLGETGNAKGTTPHLHFEVRKKKPLDPYPRIKKEFTFKEKTEYVNRTMKSSKKKSKLATFLIEHFAGDLAKADQEGLTLDKDLATALAKYRKNFSVADVPLGLGLGAENTKVTKLQTALILQGSGPFAESLSRNGTTKYFGPLTQSALREYQTKKSIPATGIFDTQTRTLLLASS